MLAHNVHIELEEIYDDIYRITEKNKTLGYMVESKNNDLPFAVVLSDGKDLGEYDCPSCVVKAVFMHVNNITDESRVFSGSSRDIAKLKAMEILSEIFSGVFQEKEVTDHDSVIKAVSESPKVLH